MSMSRIMTVFLIRRVYPAFHPKPQPKLPAYTRSEGLEFRHGMAPAVSGYARGIGLGLMAGTTVTAGALCDARGKQQDPSKDEALIEDLGRWIGVFCG